MFDEQPVGDVKRSAHDSSEPVALSLTLPANWKPAQDLGLPRLRTMETLATPRAGYISPQWSTTSLPKIKPKRHDGTIGQRGQVVRESSTLTVKSCPPSVLDMMKEAAPKKPPYLVGNTKFPKAYMEGGFVITPRGFEKTPAGLEPPFYAQSGPSVLQKGVLIKNEVSSTQRYCYAFDGYS